MTRHWPSGAFWRTVHDVPSPAGVAVSPLEQLQSVSPAGPEDRLDSWKAIAAYLGRGVRTVQRWEREEGLPVHRLAHEKRGSVYARRREVDAWWESRRRSLASDVSDSDSTEAVSSAAAVAPPTAHLERITWKAAATFWPALSSDGRLLAYVSDGGRDDELPQIWLQQIGGSPVCLTSGACERSHLAFSPDDTRLVFTGSDANGPNVYAMPTLGGEPRVLKRRAVAGRPSPDGKRLAYISLDDPAGIRIASTDDSPERTLAPNLFDVSFVLWSPDASHVLVQAHSDLADEPEFWIVPADGGEPSNTGILQRVRQRQCFPITLPASWLGNSLVFSVITIEGVRLARQVLDAVTLEPKGDAELITHGGEMDVFPTANAGRAAFVRTHADQNLWSIEVDRATGMPHGSLRRLTRGPGYIAYLSVSRDGRTLAYFLANRAGAGPVLRNLKTDVETAFAAAHDYGFPAISPSGELLAIGRRTAGPRALRPIYVGSIADDTIRKLGDDCGGRPRQWLDERFLLIERYGSRLNSIAILDTAEGAQHELLSSAEHSISNARVSPDGQWIAFDATARNVNRSLSSGLTSGPGGRPAVFVARLRVGDVIPQADWIAVDRSASHPFWSGDGSLLYYLPTVPSSELRNMVRARRFDSRAGGPSGEPFTALALTEMIVPAAMVGTAPVATPDRLVFVLGDFRGDVWMMQVR
jgi:Tol biopolymer transport system component